jgi:hypothetical protein
MIKFVKQLVILLFLVLPAQGYAQLVLDQNNVAVLGGINNVPEGVQVNNTSNLLKNNGWTGIIYGNDSTVGNCCSGGPTAVLNQDTNTIRFSYGWSTASQTVAINNALFQATGIRISGYTASALINNGGQNSGYLTGIIDVKAPGGNIIDQQIIDMTNIRNTDFVKYTFKRYYDNPYQIAEMSSITLSWIGKDDRFWAGFYGPRVRDSNLTLQYYVDPCSRNPASSPSCPGFNDLLTSINIVPYPNGVATEGNPLDNTFPIATALSNSGSGLALHGFKYGFTYDLGPATQTSDCVSYSMAGVCGAYKSINPFASVKVDIRNSSNQSLFSQAYNFNGADTGPVTMAYQYLFPDSTNTNLMGNFKFNASVQGDGTVYNMYGKLIVTPDPCTSNPYYSPKCTGFTEAIDKLTGTNKTDYATTGYTEAAEVTAATSAIPGTTLVTTSTGDVIVLNSPPPPTSTDISQPSTVQQPLPQQNTSNSQPPPPPGSSPQQGPLPQGGQSPVVAQSTSASDKSSGTGQVVTSVSTKDNSSLSVALNTIAKNKEIEQALVLSVIQNAISDAQNVSTKAEQEAISFVEKVNSINVTTSVAMSSATDNNSVKLLALASTNKSTTNTASSTSAFRENNQTPVVVLLTPSATAGLSTPASEVSLPPTNFFVDKASPINNLLTAKLNEVESKVELKIDSVNKSVEPNELAGSVDINTIASVPVGYGDYLSLTLKDNAFYIPKEIYKNIIIKDNVRNAYFLEKGNTDTYNKMVQEQYK